MRAVQLVREFVEFAVVEPVLTVTLGVVAVLVGLVRAAWVIVLGFLLFVWVGWTILALLAGNGRGLEFSLYFAGLFLLALILKRALAFPLKKLGDAVLDGRQARRRHA